MPFDPSSASPVQPQATGFDPSSAQPVSSGSFDPGSAQPVHQSLWDKAQGVARGLESQYTQAVMSGPLAQPVRYAMEHLDTGGIEDQLRQQNPNATDDQIATMKHNVYGNAVVGARDRARQDVANNPYGNGFVHGAGNIAASIIANPQDLVLGASGVGGNVATRLATGAAFNAGIGGASDAAAQIMDLAEGQKKKYDVQQSLVSAAMGGAMGGGMQAVHEVAPFVAGLFGNRGKDTTPNATPDGTNSPLTGDTPTMTPEQVGQLRQLIRTGSVDDIKGFLADKQGPKPTYQQVNDLVQTRDAIPDTLPQAQTAFDSHIQDTRTQALQDHIDQTTANWKNKPDVVYHNSIDDIEDPQMRQEVQAQADSTGKPPPGFYGDDGKVHVFADQVHSPEQANALLFHEGLGHFGLAEKFGAGLDNTINTLMSRNVGQFGKDVDQWQADHPGAYNGDRTRAGEEVLAEMSEKGPLKPSLGDAVASHVRRFGRAMGMDLSYSDAEVRHVLSMSHDAVVNGKGRAVGANNYRSPLASNPNDPGNRFMFTGPSAHHFDMDSATRYDAQDGIPRNEISDTGAQLKGNPDTGDARLYEKGDYRLGDVLSHPELFNEYPELKYTDVRAQNMPGSLKAGYDPKAKRILVDPRDPDLRSSLLHEVQHRIQDHEGYPGMGEEGGSMGKSYEEYRKDPLEMEAFTTEDRLHMNADERATAYRPRFMDADRLAAMGAKDVHEEAFKKFGEDYVPKYRSWDDAKAAAADTALAPEDVKDSRAVGNLDRKLFVYNNAAKVAQDRLFTLADKAEAAGGMTDADKVELASAVNDFHYVLGRLDNDLGQVGRALNAAKNLEFRRNNIQELQKMLKEEGSPLGGVLDDDTAQKFLRQFSQMKGNPNGAANMLKQLTKPNWEDYVVTFHNAAMLSGLSTHVKAPQDMMIGIGRDLLNNVGALPFSAARQALIGLGMDLKPGVHPIEVASRFNGLFRAFMDSDTYLNTAKTLARGQVNPSGFSGKTNARIPIVSKVMDLISAQDTFFRAFATNMHLYGEGAARALDEFREANGREPKLSEFDQLNIQGQAHARLPSQGMLDRAKAKADEVLLLNKNKLTEPLDRWKQTTNQSSAGRRVGAFLMNILTPFVRVESNSLYNRVIRNSPLTLLDPKTWGEIKEGGRTADVAFARIAYGMAAFGAAWQASKSGKLTGEGPQNPDKKAVLESTGWRPNAVHENGQYNTGNQLGSSFNPLDVHNETAMTVASLRDAWKEGKGTGGNLLQQVGTGIGFALMSTLSKLANMSYVTDLQPVMDAATAKGPTGRQKIGQAVGDEAATFVPNLASQYGRVTNQDQKQTNNPGVLSTIGANVQNAVPGARNNLSDRVDPLGSTYQSGASGAGQHSWMPQDNHLTSGNHLDETTDPAKQEIARLDGLAPKHALVSPVQRTIQGVDTTKFDPSQVDEDGKVKLTNEQYAHYQHVAGLQIVGTMKAEMDSPEWKTMSDNDRAGWLHQMQKDQKKAVKEYLYGSK